jgi:hypothetical protein
MKAKNSKVIENAFKRFATTEASAVISGMKSLLDAAVTYALKIHEERSLHNHLERGDSYGWALGVQGQCVAIKITEWEDLPDTDIGIKDKIKEIVENYSAGKKNKYVGIVMAGMKPKEIYNFEFEEEILDDTMNMITGDFDRYFHVIPDSDFDKLFRDI